MFSSEITFSTSAAMASGLGHFKVYNFEKIFLPWR
jgi:hypothetical protein